MTDSNHRLRLATLEDNGWELESGVERHRTSPTSFWIPDEHRRRQLRIGHRVKLLFLIKDGDDPLSCERMWVTVLGKQNDDYVGILESQPRTRGALATLTELVFGPDHIVDIIGPDLEFAELFRDRLRGVPGDLA